MNTNKILCTLVKDYLEEGSSIIYDIQDVDIEKTKVLVGYYYKDEYYTNSEEEEYQIYRTNEINLSELIIFIYSKIISK